MLRRPKTVDLKFAMNQWRFKVIYSMIASWISAILDGCLSIQQALSYVGVEDEGGEPWNGRL